MEIARHGADWRTSTWRTVERIQHEHERGPALVLVHSADRRPTAVEPEPGHVAAGRPRGSCVR